MRAPEFWHTRTAGAAILATLLVPFGWLHGLSIRLRQMRARPFRARAKVLCVGNLTAGGSGKTPVAIALARMLQARGARVVFLTRGYGGTAEGPVAVTSHHAAAEIGDEPLLLARVAQTVVSRNRAPGAAVCDAMDADVIVMDDGHQNFQIAKDLSIVVVGSGGFGNGRIVPAGPLRESITQGLSRADVVVLMENGEAKFSFNRPILLARTVPGDENALRGLRVFAFAGIGAPGRFFESLQEMGAKVVGTRVFADHHPFTESEIAALRKVALESNARLVTTEKDFVRLSPAQRADIVALAIRVVFENEGAAEALLDRVYLRATEPTP